MATGRRALAANPKGAKRRKPLRFGILTDTHYSDREVGGTRHYRDSLQKMQEAIDEFNRAEVDFIIELGDMKDMPKSADPAKTLADLDRIEAIFQQFDGATYHVLGNHDMDCISKEEFLAHTTNTGRAKGKSYYSFAARGVRCIVLDANFNADLTPYCRGSFDWTSAQVPPQQLEWLEAELKAHAKEPTLIFLHQLLDSFSGVSKSVCVRNAADVVAIIERHPQVLAVFQGHHHPGHYSHRNDIHYITLNGMIEKAAPAHNSFAIVELSASGDITLTGYHDCPSRKL
ncbi:MAG: metallophosphoesterase [Alistipes sp.]|nr:metallophosphoesterase [Alistipes sp.]